MIIFNIFIIAHNKYIGIYPLNMNEVRFYFVHNSFYFKSKKISKSFEIKINYFNTHTQLSPINFYFYFVMTEFFSFYPQAEISNFILF